MPLYRPGRWWHWLPYTVYKKYILRNINSFRTWYIFSCIQWPCAFRTSMHSRLLMSRQPHVCGCSRWPCNLAWACAAVLRFLGLPVRQPHMFGCMTVYLLREYEKPNQRDVDSSHASPLSVILIGICWLWVSLCCMIYNRKYLGQYNWYVGPYFIQIFDDNQHLFILM